MSGLPFLAQATFRLALLLVRLRLIQLSAMAEPIELAALAQAQAAEAAGGALSGTAGVIQTSAEIAHLESALNKAKAPSMNFQRLGGGC